MDINLHHHGTVPAQHPWPEDIGCLQGGSDGVVFARGEGSYRTAFVEVSDPRFGFIRGEGATIALAEDVAWAKAQRAMRCPGHEWETRGYDNGCGFCKHCDRFGSGVFSLAEVGSLCAACDKPTNWTHFTRPDTGEQIKMCKLHAACDGGWLCGCAICVARQDAKDAVEVDLSDGQQQEFAEAAYWTLATLVATLPPKTDRARPAGGTPNTSDGGVKDGAR